MTNPRAVLFTPVASEPVPDLVQRILGITSYLSLSGLAREVLTTITGHDPLEDVTEYFGGDWSKVSEAADALRNLGAFHGLYAEELVTVERTLGADWDGQAADAARQYVQGFADAVSRQVSEFEDVASEYDQLALAMWQTADVVGNLLCTVIDLALVAAASAAVGTATSWTGVGAVLGGLGTLGAVIAAAATIAEIADLYDRAVTLVELASAAINSELASMASFEGARLPAAYDHPFAEQP